MINIYIFVLCVYYTLCIYLYILVVYITYILKVAQQKATTAFCNTTQINSSDAKEFCN